MTDQQTFNYQFDVDGMTCAACVANVEKALRSVPGVTDVTVNLATESANVESHAAIPVKRLSRSVSKMGYRLDPQGSASLIERQQQNIDRWKKLLATQSIVGIPLLVYAMLEMFGGLPTVAPLLNIGIQFSLASIMVVTGIGYYQRGFKHLIQGVPNMDSLVALGTGAAYLYSLITALNQLANLGLAGFETLYFEAAGTILLFITLGKWLEAVARGKSTEALSGLSEQMPREARVWRNNTWEMTPMEQVHPGDRIQVLPHERIPVDGTVLKGVSDVNEASISGESLPATKEVGDSVLGASINLQSILELEAKAVGRESAFGQVVALVEAAQGKKPEIQKLVDKVAAVFVPVVLVLAILSGATWIVLGYGLTFAVNVLISVLIIACPCALGLATPTALVVASGLAARSGILIKSADALQQFSKIDTLIFDKTGTLTKGDIRLKAHFPTDNTNFLAFAMGLEAQSSHPLAKSLLDYGQSQGISGFPFSEVTETAGIGVRGFHEGKEYAIARIKAEDLKDSTFEDAHKGWMQKGYMVSGVTGPEGLLGLVAFSDSLKPEAPGVVTEMEQRGVSTVLATGDGEAAAHEVAGATGIQTTHARVLPSGKYDLVKTYQKAGKTVAMLGDGINDAPALTVADVGLSFGGGTDIAMNAADIIFMDDGLVGLITAHKLSRATLNKIKQNLFWAFAYNLVGIPIAMGVLYPFTGMLLNPMFAGMAMAFSSVSVVANTLLLKRRKF